MTRPIMLEHFCDAPKNTVIRVVWRSEGRGDPERHVVQTLKPDVQTSEIPTEAPITYDGQLFRIIWQLELWLEEKLLETRAVRVGVHTPDPYLACGLKRNPFALEIGPVPAHLWLDRGSSRAPLANSGTLWQVLGVRGAGKSSQVRHWREQTGGAYHYCHPNLLSRFTPPPVASIAYWDEADRIASALLRNAFARAARVGATIVIGTHRDVSGEATRAGIKKIQTIRLGRIHRSQLLEWAAQRIQASSLPTGTAYTISVEDAEVMLEQSPDSWRELAGLLHAHCATWVALSDEQKAQSDDRARAPPVPCF
jgi:hypothetical protein